MKKQVIALQMQLITITIAGEEVKVELPDGCIGIMFCFDSKKAAWEYCGKECELAEIWPVTKNKNFDKITDKKEVQNDKRN